MAAFLSGGILLGLEVVWFRFLLLFVDGTGIAGFAFMLSAVLAGIALGGIGGIDLARSAAGGRCAGLPAGGGAGRGVAGLTWSTRRSTSRCAGGATGWSLWVPPKTAWLSLALGCFRSRSSPGCSFRSPGGAAALHRQTHRAARRPPDFSPSRTRGGRRGALPAGFVLCPGSGSSRAHGCRRVPRGRRACRGPPAAGLSGPRRPRGRRSALFARRSRSFPRADEVALRWPSRGRAGVRNRRAARRGARGESETSSTCSSIGSARPSITGSSRTGSRCPARITGSGAT